MSSNAHSTGPALQPFCWIHDQSAYFVSSQHSSIKAGVVFCGMHIYYCLLCILQTPSLFIVLHHQKIPSTLL